MCLSPDHPVTDQEDRPTCLSQNLDRPVHLARQRLRQERRLHAQRPIHLTIAHRFHRNILRQFQMSRTGLFGLRNLERLAHRLGNGPRVKDLGVPFRDRPEHGQDVDELMRFFVHPIQRGLSRNRDQRGAIQIRVCYAGEQISCTGPQSGETDPGLSCQPPMDIGHEGRALLVSGGNKPDLRIHERVQDVQRLLSGHAEDPPHPFIFQTT